MARIISFIAVSKNLNFWGKKAEKEREREKRHLYMLATATPSSLCVAGCALNHCSEKIMADY